MLLRPALIVLLIVAVATLLSLPVAAHPPTDAPTLGAIADALATEAGEVAALAGDSDATAPTVPGEATLLRAALHAIESGNGWLAVALLLATLVAVLRARGLIHHRPLAAISTVVLSLLGGPVHHLAAGTPMTSDMVLTSLYIAAVSMLGLAWPTPARDPGRLQERK